MRTPAQRTGATQGSNLDIGALSARWYELRQAPRDDIDAQQELRQVLARLRKVKHVDIHPDCPMVEIDVPLHSASTMQKPVYFAIGNASQRRIFHGKCLVHRCVAHQILHQISQDRATDARRLTAGGGIIQETGRISDIARTIATEA